MIGNDRDTHRSGYVSATVPIWQLWRLSVPDPIWVRLDCAHLARRMRTTMGLTNDLDMGLARRAMKRAPQRNADHHHACQKP